MSSLKTASQHVPSSVASTESQHQPEHTSHVMPLSGPTALDEMHLTPDYLLHLQRTVGNQATIQLMKAHRQPTAQPSDRTAPTALRSTPPQVARTIQKMPAPVLQRRKTTYMPRLLLANFTQLHWLPSAVRQQLHLLPEASSDERSLALDPTFVKEDAKVVWEYLNKVYDANVGKGRAKLEILKQAIKAYTENRAQWSQANQIKNKVEDEKFRQYYLSKVSQRKQKYVVQSHGFDHEVGAKQWPAQGIENANYGNKFDVENGYIGAHANFAEETRRVDNQIIVHDKARNVFKRPQNVAQAAQPQQAEDKTAGATATSTAQVTQPGPEQTKATATSTVQDAQPGPEQAGATATSTAQVTQPEQNRGERQGLNNSEILWQQYKLAAQTHFNKPDIQQAEQEEKVKEALAKINHVSRQGVGNEETIETVHIATDNGKLWGNNADQGWGVESEESAAILGTPNGQSSIFLVKDHLDEIEKTIDTVKVSSEHKRVLDIKLKPLET